MNRKEFAVLAGFVSFGGKMLEELELQEYIKYCCAFFA
jgi:hypothetical protein